MEPVLDIRIQLLTRYSIAKDVVEWLKENDDLPTTVDVHMLALDFACGPGPEDRAWLVRTLKGLA